MASTKSVRVSTYIKNVAKSFGYAIGDVFSEYNPVISSIGKETKSSAENIYESIKSIKAKASDTDENSIKSKAKNIVDSTWNNFKDDIKSGNWYNKNRKEQADNEMAKAMGFDLDFDFDFDDDFNEDDSTETIVTNDDKNAAKIISAVDEVGSALSSSINTTTVEAASYIARTNSKTTKALYLLNERGFTAVNNSIGALNKTLGSFAQITEPLSQHMQNSSIFFTKTTDTLEKINQNIQQIVKNTTPPPLASNGRKNTIKGQYTDIFDSDGMISLDSYKDMIKDNFKDYKDLIDMATGMAKKGGEGIGKNISLMQHATIMMTKVMLPKIFKESMKNFNEDIKNFISGGFLKMREGYSSNIFIELLKDMVLPKDGFRSRINTANYEKGQVAWDGISRKALVEVIPTTLLKIYSAITGAPEQVYDYNTGKLITVGKIQQLKNITQRSYAQRAGGDFRRDTLDKVDKNDSLSKEQKAQLTKEIENYFYNAFMKGTGFTNVNDRNFNAKDFGLSQESLAIIREMVNATDSKSRRNRGNFVSGIGRERSNYGDFIRNTEASGNSTDVYLENGFFSDENKNTGLKSNNLGVDKFNNKASVYLRGIYLYTGLLADNLKFIAGKADEINYAGTRSRIKKNVNDTILGNNTSSSSSTGGERTREQANTSTGSSSTNDNFMDEDQARNKEREDNIKEAKKQASGKFKKILGKFTGLFKKDNPNSIVSIYNKPFEAIAGLLDRIGISMDRFLWGKGDNDDTSLFGYIKKKTKEQYEKLSKWLDDKFKIKEKWNKFKDKMLGTETGVIKDDSGKVLYKKDKDGNWRNSNAEIVSEEEVKEANGGNLRSGGVLKNVGNQFTNSLKNVKDSLGKTAKQIFKGKDNGTAAHGRRVTKSGIVAVSEGELIIPSELNPFYHGITNKRNQERNEQRIVNKFFGSFANGKTSVGEDSSPDDDKKYESVKDIFVEGFSRLGNGASEVFNRLFGDGTKENAEKEKKVINSVGSKLVSEAGENLGHMGAGALIGAGTSIVTGAVVGPLLGAGIGAAVGLIANSKTVRHILFGADPETGEINGGLLSKNVSEFMMKKVPTLAKGGALGAVAGTIMGSPLLGAVAGTAVSYIATSEKAKKWLFGDKADKDDDSGLISKSVQQRIKKALPNMAVGAIAGLVAGPFGIAGNIIFGGALGYLTTSNKFHDWMFGDPNNKKDKGFVGIVKEKILDNLDITFHNIFNSLSGFTKNLLTETKDKIKDFFTKKARAYENGENQSFLGKVIGGTVSLTGKAVKGATSGVGNILGGVARRTQAHNLRKGYNVYGVGEDGKKKNLTAEERLKIRSNGIFGEFDKLLANAKTPEELKELRELLQNAKDPSAVLKRELNSILGTLYSALENQDPKVANKIGKLVEKGAKSGDKKSLDKALDMLRNLGLSANQYEQAKNAIIAAGAALHKANSSRDVLKNFKKAGMNFDKNGNLNNAIDRIDDELKNRKDLTPEEQDKLEQKDWRERVLKIIESIEEKVVGKPKNEKEENKSSDENKTSDNGGFDDNTKAEKKGIRSELDMFGNVHQYEENNQGELTEVTNDSETRKSRDVLNKFTDSIGHIPLIGGAVTGLMAKLFGKDDNDKEPKEGLLSKFGKFLFGEDGIFGENGIFGGIRKLFKGKSFKEGMGFLFKGIIAPALLLGGFAGKFDNLGAQISNIKLLKGNDTQATLDDNRSKTVNGKQLTLDENGNPITNEKGEYQTTTGEWVSGTIKSVGEDTRVSTQLKKNLINGVIMNFDGTAKSLLKPNSSLTTKVLGGAKKTWNKFLGKGVEEAAENPGLINGIMSSVAKALESIPKILNKIPFIPKSVVDGADTIVTTIYTHLDDVVKKAGSKLKSLATKIGNIMPLIKIGSIALAGIDAWGNAESILGITEDATFGQKIIAVLITVINKLIPIIGDLIPNKVLVNIFMDIAPKIGIDVSDLAAQRERANDEVTKYNEENGTDFSIEEYNQMNGRAGVVTKAKNWVKDKWNTLKEKGVGGVVSDIGNGIKAGAGAVVDTVQKGFSKVNELTGFTEIFKMMKEGDIKGVISYTSADEDDSTGMKVVKQIPTLVTKYTAIVPTMFIALGKKVGEVVSNVVKKIKGIMNIAQEEKDRGEQMIMSQASLGEFLKIEDPDPENPMGGFEKAFRLMTRISSVPIVIVKKIGNSIRDAFVKIGTTIKTSFNTLVQNEVNIKKSAISGDIEGLWGLESPDNPENPLNGIMKGVLIVQKVMNTPLAAVSWVGHKIADAFVSIATKVKNAFTAVTKNEITLKKAALAGEIGELWSNEVEDDPENPLNGIMGGINFVQKVMNTPLAAVSWVGHKIGDFFTSMVEKVKTNKQSLDTSIDKIKEFASKGDLESIWKEDLKLEDGDPLKFVWGAAFNINRLFQSAVALFNKILEPIKGLIDKAKNFVGDVKDAVGGWVGDRVDDAKSWLGDKWDSFTSWVSGGASGIKPAPQQNNAFVSQFDQKYKDKKLGSSTVGEKGCGPAVATMVANSYGINTSMDDALKAAGPYQDKNGTKATYFQDYLGKAGLQVNQLSGKNIDKEVMDNLANGKQLILLGQDAKNTSKKNSPFGPKAHYVVASGIDNNGNIIIKDPEGNGPVAYNPSILKNIKTGFGTTGSGGASNYDTDTAKKVWAYFTSSGYSPAATAGIMGNLYAESGMDPTRHQMGGGPAAGIAQWEKYGDANTRWGSLNKFAQESGYQWSDLDPQLKFIHHELSSKDIDNRFAGKYGMGSLNAAGAQATTYEQWKKSTDPAMATRQFEGAFERAGKPHMDNRLTAATEYYKLYHDKNYTYTPDPSNGVVDNGGVGVASTGGVGDSSSTGSTGSTSMGNILSQIGTIFTTALGKAFGDKSADATSTGGVGGVAPSGSYDSSSFSGLSENVVDGVTGPGNEKQKALANKLLGIKGQITYSMQGPRDPEKGSADCSSTVNWAYKKVTGTDIGNNTDAMLKSDATEIIDMAPEADKSAGVRNGSGPNLGKLMPGDIMLYSRPDSTYNAGWPYRTGHVEMYIGNGQRIGHGGNPNTGPNVTDAKKDAGRYIMAKRLKGITDNDPIQAKGGKVYNESHINNGAQFAAMGSGLYSYDELANLSAGSSGILMKARPGTKVNGGQIRQLSMKYSGGDSGMIEQTKSMLNQVANNAKAQASKGSISAEVVERLLNAIIKVLESIANNTSPIDKIYQVLAQYTKISAANDTAKTTAVADTVSNSSNNNSEIDSNIAALVGQLAQIAKG